MTVQEINNQLYRPLLSGSQFDSLFKTSHCKPKYLGTGNTKIVLGQMKKWAFKHQDQTEMLSEALLQNDLVSTVNNIQWFLFNHIQYSIDEKDQKLKSPGCAWATRQAGSDCKTYTIVGSCILLNLGIHHYLTRVKLNDPDAFTHVYIKIPLNQDNPKLTKQSKFLEDYIIIDGTIQKNYEQQPLDNDNLYMEPDLPIYGLAMPQVEQTMALGCGCNNATPTPALNGFLDDFSVGDIFGGGWSPSCIGGTLDRKDFNVVVDGMASGSDVLYQNFNNAVASGDLSAITQAVNKIFSETNAVRHKAARYKAYDWSSRCSRDASSDMLQVMDYYRDIVNNVFKPFIQKYFDYDVQIGMVYNQEYSFPIRENGQGIYKPNFNGDAMTEVYSNMQFKPNAESIPVFEIDQYVIDNVQSSSFNFNQFLNSLSNTALQLIDPNSGGNTTDPNNGSGNDNGGYTPPPPANTSVAGFGKVAGYAALAWLGYEAYKKYGKKK